MNPPYSIGNVSVVKANPPNGNPYRGESLIGTPRKDALRKFKAGEPQPEYEFWYAPCCGGAKPCTRDDVNWATSSL